MRAPSEHHQNAQEASRESVDTGPRSVVLCLFGVIAL